MLDAALLVKLFAAPLLIGLASLAGRRWGPNVAGLLGGLPLVGAPVVLGVWLTHGAPYAEQVARTAPAGLWANIVYMLAVGWISARLRWYWAIPLGWAAYLAAALLVDVSGLATALWLGIAVIPGLWLAAMYGLPRPRKPPPRARLPRIELLTRMLAAAALVISLTAVSQTLGPELTGILAGAPVAAVVIPAFTFATAGRDALLLALRGFLTGLMGFAVFFLILAPAIPALGLLAFLPALLGGVAVGLLATRLAHRAFARALSANPSTSN